MRILFTIYNPNSGGSVMSTTRRQAEHLAAGGHVVTLVANEFPTGWNGIDYIEARTPDTRTWARAEYIVHGICRRLPGALLRFDLRRFLPQYRFSHAITDVISKLQMTESVDGIICCQHFCAPGLMQIRQSRGTPFILVAHGDIFSHPDDSFPAPLRQLYRRTAKLSYQHACKVVSVSSRLAERAVELGAASENVAVIPNGIAEDELGPIPSYQQDHDNCSLLFVGRLAPEKAVAVLLKAIASLNMPSLQLNIVGDGPSRPQLTRLVQSLNLSTQVVFSGHVPRNSLGQYYAKANIVVLPSLTEAQPVVTLEALVAGRPIIASNVGGIPDVVRHGWNGLLVPPDDVDELANALRQLACDPGLRDQLGQNASSLAGRFAWPHVLDHFHSEVSQAFQAAVKV